MDQSFSAQLQDAIKPLVDSGLTPDQASQIIIAFGPLIQNIFEDRIRQTFSESEIASLNQSGANLSPTDSISKLEEEYEKKTGKGFLTLYRDIVAELVPVIIDTIKDTKSSWQKLVDLGPEEIKRLAAAVKNRDSATTQSILSKIQPA
jgi:hypothetical protein